MTRTNKTRSALFTSVLSLLLCVSMLVGTTFAWFTDSASTGNTVIQSGTLDIVLEYWDGDSWENAEGVDLEFVKKAGWEYQDVLWEPGCTYELPKVRVRNEGNLTAYIIVKLSGVTGSEKLLEAITLQTKVSNIPESMKTGSQAEQWASMEGKTYTPYYGTTDGNVLMDWTLAPKGEVTPNSGTTDTSAEFTISGHMDEAAGNEYQGLTLEGISVEVFATQAVYEFDSYDREYDENAPKMITINGEKYDTIAAAVAAAKDGDTIALAGAYTLPTIQNKTLTFTAIEDNYATISIPAGVTAAGSTLTFDGVTIQGYDKENNYYTTQLNNAVKATYKNCTIKGLITTYCPSDFIDCVFENTFADQYSIFDYGASIVNVTGCTFNTATDEGKAIKLYNEGTGEATLNVTNCTFNAYRNAGEDQKAAIQIDSRFTTLYTVNITDCTINENYTKLWADVGDNSVVTINGKVATEVAVGTAADLQTILNNAFQNGGNEDITIELTQDIDVNGEWAIFAIPNTATNITIDGKGYTISNLNKPLMTGLWGGYGTLTVKNLTIKNAKIENFDAAKDANGTVSASGALLAYSDAGTQINVIDCKLVDSVISGNADYTGGFIGYASTPVNFSGCSVTGSTISGNKSTGALLGHQGADDLVIANCTVTGNTLGGARDNETDVGEVFGRTSGGDTVTMTNITSSNNIIYKAYGTDAQAVAVSKLYGSLNGYTATLDGNAVN